MKSKSSLFNVAATGLMGAVFLIPSIANATDTVDNPLHPSYYSSRAKAPPPIVARNTTDFSAIAHNPLHPSYAKTTFNVAWIATGAGDGKPYVDSRNPLHPSYKFH